jgi:UDPglucose--hexose-1-phosphate uridylyltransferase
MSIPFRTATYRGILVNPNNGFAREELPFEIRHDPLTGETGRIFELPFRAEKPDLEATVKKSLEFFCPFCPENLEKSTSLFPEEMISGGRIREGEATLIPNMIPFDQYAGVSILSHRHYVPMEALTPQAMRDGFTAAIRFIRAVCEHDAKVTWFSLNWNYFPPAGSSIVHPHLQPNCGELPPNQLRLQLERCAGYRDRTGRTFWDDFVEAEEKKQERYVGRTGPVTWIMSFVPWGFVPDVSCVFAEGVSLMNMDESRLMSFLDGLSRVFACFRQQNIYSFNLSLFSMREEAGFRTNGRVCPRLHPRPIGNSDISYLQMLHKEPYAARRPETVCRELREFF